MLKEIPLTPMQVIGYQKGQAVILGTMNLVKPEEREKTVDEILRQFAENEIVIIGNTLVYTENFDAFRVI